MKKPLGFPLLLLVAVTIILSFSTSCVTQRQVKYLQKAQKTDTSSVYHNIRAYDYRIQPMDNLYIRIYSLDEKTYLFFNRQSVSGGNISSEYTTDAAIYLNSYSVNDSGFIDFPVIGKIFVMGSTLDQAKQIIQKHLNEYLKETSVVVKMVNFNITVLGEVRTPGEKKIYQDKVNIFEAISMAGDLNDFGNRARVALIRQTTHGSKVIYLNLNRDNILASEYYYLMPNDIIYVAPMGIKRWGTETFPWALVFSALSTALLLINYFK